MTFLEVVPPLRFGALGDFVAVAPGLPTPVVEFWATAVPFRPATAASRVAVWSVRGGAGASLRFFSRIMPETWTGLAFVSRHDSRPSKKAMYRPSGMGCMST